MKNRAINVQLACCLRNSPLETQYGNNVHICLDLNTITPSSRRHMTSLQRTTCTNTVRIGSIAQIDFPIMFPTLVCNKHHSSCLSYSCQLFSDIFETDDTQLNDQVKQCISSSQIVHLCLEVLNCSL